MWLLTLRSILVATDLGEASLPALSVSDGVARRTPCPLLLVPPAARVEQGA